MTEAPASPTLEGRIAELRGRGVPPAFWAPLRRDPLLMVADRLIAPGARILALLSPRGMPRETYGHARELVLVDREPVAADADVVSFVFAHPRGAVLRTWWPGAHLDVVLPSGRMRQYSLCGDPDDPFHYRIAVRRIAGGSGSIELHDQLRPGMRVGFRGPRNAFPLSLTGHLGTSPRLRFVAGGIGITPILGMIRAAERAGADWSLIYTGRHRDALPFLDELTGYGDRVTVRTDDVEGLPTGEELVPQPDSELAVYVCGPPALLDVVAARVAHVPGLEFHHERFAPPPIVDGQPFTVQWGSGGPILDVPADRSVLSVVAETDPAVSYSCRQGFCTTCKVRVLSGTVEHRDTVLDAAQRAQGDMLICVSRGLPGQRLVLDAGPARRADAVG